MRMMIDIPQKWKQSWDTWELQVCIISSLSLQTFLIFFAPLRKRTSSTWLIIPLWSAYLLADWVANFSLGLILNNQGNPNGEEELLAFWAPFLLVHLGGPDTITAFALEDNEFWLRHLIGLVIQFSATVYVFVRSLPHNQLWLPTILILMNGTIKYAERTSAFYLASAERFKQSINTNIQMTPKPGNENLTEWEVVRHAYYFFSTFKGRVVDQVFKRTAWEESREFFLKQTAKDAFPVVEVELNFIYLVLFTKLPVLNGHFRTIRPLVSFVLICPAIVLFFKVQKTKFSTIDVRITYGLLFNALALDILARLMLLFSVNTVLLLSKSLEPGKEPLWLRILIIFHTRSNPSKQRWPIQFFNRRWSETIRTYNIIDFCLHPHSRFKKFVCSLLGLRVYVDSIRYVKTKRLTENLKDFIFDELKSKSNDAKLLNEATKISSSRGDRVLSDEASWSHILPYTLDDDFGQRILLWHVATNLW